LLYCTAAAENAVKGTRVCCSKKIPCDQALFDIIEFTSVSSSSLNVRKYSIMSLSLFLHNLQCHGRSFSCTDIAKNLVLEYSNCSLIFCHKVSEGIPITTPFNVLFTKKIIAGSSFSIPKSLLHNNFLVSFCFSSQRILTSLDIYFLIGSTKCAPLSTITVIFPLIYFCEIAPPLVRETSWSGARDAMNAVTAIRSSGRNVRNSFIVNPAR